MARSARCSRIQSFVQAVASLGRLPRSAASILAHGVAPGDGIPHAVRVVRGQDILRQVRVQHRRLIQSHKDADSPMEPVGRLITGPGTRSGQRRRSPPAPRNRRLSETRSPAIRPNSVTDHETLAVPQDRSQGNPSDANRVGHQGTSSSKATRPPRASCRSRTR